VLATDGYTTVSADSDRIRWTFDAGYSTSSSPTVVDETVFVGSGDTNLYAVDAATGNEQWALETGGEVYSSPTVVDGTVFVGSGDTNLYALDSKTGDKQWDLKLADDGGVESSTVVDGTIFVTIERGNLFAVDAGVNGSSEDSRVLLGTQRHHSDWQYADQSIDIPAYAWQMSRVRNNRAAIVALGTSIGSIYVPPMDSPVGTGILQTV
jgi:outer membrane protein assembly factor BamB